MAGTVPGGQTRTDDCPLVAEVVVEVQHGLLVFVGPLLPAEGGVEEGVAE